MTTTITLWECELMAGDCAERIQAAHGEQAAEIMWDLWRDAAYTDRGNIDPVGLMAAIEYEWNRIMPGRQLPR